MVSIAREKSPFKVRPRTVDRGARGIQHPMRRLKVGSGIGGCGPPSCGRYNGNGGAHDISCSQKLLAPGPRHPRSALDFTGADGAHAKFMPI
jgi:hypothetical protein